MQTDRFHANLETVQLLRRVFETWGITMWRVEFDSDAIVIRYVLSNLTSKEEGTLTLTNRGDYAYSVGDKRKGHLYARTPPPPALFVHEIVPWLNQIFTQNPVRDFRS